MPGTKIKDKRGKKKKKLPFELPASTRRLIEEIEEATREIEEGRCQDQTSQESDK